MGRHRGCDVQNNKCVGVGNMSCPNLSDYISAGFVPICGCRLDTALDYVYRIIFPTRPGFNTDGWVRYDAEHSAVVVNVGDEDVKMWAGSGYYWESDTLFKASRINGGE